MMEGLFKELMPQTLASAVAKETSCQQQQEEPTAICLVCFDTSDGLHFGVYTCRACAAFFRRTVSLRLEYKCKAHNDCQVHKSARNMCRSCRFTKCIGVGMQISAVQQGRDGIGKRNERRSPNAHDIRPNSVDSAQIGGSIVKPILTFSQFPSAFTAVREPPTQPMRLLPKMHEGYLHFLTVRKATHSLIDNENLTKMFQQGSDMTMKQSNFDTAKRVCQLEAHLVTDIVNSYFYPFSELPFAEKVLLFKNFFCYLSHTDRAYQSYKLFGGDESNDRLLMPDGGFVKASELERFYANSEGVHSTPEEAAKIFRPALHYILNVIIAHMKRIQITEFEYIAILGFFLWSESVPSLAKETIEIVHDTQEVLLSDLNIHYRQMGLDGSQITHRCGLLMLLLPKLTRSVVMLRENSELAELFNLFEADVCCKSFIGDFNATESDQLS